MKKKIKPLRVVMDAYVCECCYLWLANDDTSSCRDYYNHGEAEHPRALCSGLAGNWVVGNGRRWILRAGQSQTCAGCGGEVLPQGSMLKVNQLGR